MEDLYDRFIVYGIRDLGESLAPLAMLVMLETIQQKIISNGENGKATWLYIDEIHVLLTDALEISPGKTIEKL